MQTTDKEIQLIRIKIAFIKEVGPICLLKNAKEIQVILKCCLIMAMESNTLSPKEECFLLPGTLVNGSDFV